MRSSHIQIDAAEFTSSLTGRRSLRLFRGEVAHYPLPLLPRRYSAPWNLFSLALDEVLMLVGEAFRPGDVFQVSWRLPLVASPADRRQAIGIVRVIGLVTQGEGRAVIENEEADDEPCPAAGTAAFLAQQWPVPPRSSSR